MVPVCMETDDLELRPCASLDDRRPEADPQLHENRPEVSLLNAANDAIARTLSNDSPAFLELYRQRGGE